jgi:hypothetical protein
MKKSIFLLLVSILLLSACSASPIRTPRTATTKTPTAQTLVSTATLKSLPSATPQPTEAPTAMPVVVVLTQDTTCRLGPGENYYKMILELKGDKFEPQGRNEDNTWVLVNENSADSESPTCWLPASALVSADGISGLSLAKYELLPPAPSSITAPNGVCGSNKAMIVKWSPVAEGAEYRLYRNGKAVSTQSGGSFYDVNIPEKGKATVLTYVVQGINDYGTSPSVAVSVTVCGK